MIIHQNTLISEDIIDNNFVCNLEKCKGACCIEGEFGAPLEEDEIKILEIEFKNYKPFLSDTGIRAITKNGVWEKDRDGDSVTTCLPNGQCNFSIYENGILGCGIEKAFNEGKTVFRKPISCHLYPVRITKIAEFDALNYNRWDICKPACNLGNKHKLPIYKFLKDALIRRYGKNWYDELELVCDAYSDSKIV